MNRVTRTLCARAARSPERAGGGDLHVSCAVACARGLRAAAQPVVAVLPVTIVCERINAAGQAVVQRALLRFVESGEHLALDFCGGP